MTTTWSSQGAAQVQTGQHMHCNMLKHRTGNSADNQRPTADAYTLSPTRAPPYILSQCEQSALLGLSRPKPVPRSQEKSHECIMPHSGLRFRAPCERLTPGLLQAPTRPHKQIPKPRFPTAPILLTITGPSYYCPMGARTPCPTLVSGATPYSGVPYLSHTKQHTGRIKHM